jgi:hypothetical protein
LCDLLLTALFVEKFPKNVINSGLGGRGTIQLPTAYILNRFSAERKDRSQLHQQDARLKGKLRTIENKGKRRKKKKERLLA